MHVRARSARPRTNILCGRTDLLQRNCLFLPIVIQKRKKRKKALIRLFKILISLLLLIDQCVGSEIPGNCEAKVQVGNAENDALEGNVDSKMEECAKLATKTMRTV